MIGGSMARIHVLCLGFTLAALSGGCGGGGSTENPPRCGDGAVTVGEACDDGNAVT